VVSSAGSQSANQGSIPRSATILRKCVSALGAHTDRVISARGTRTGGLFSPPRGASLRALFINRSRNGNHGGEVGLIDIEGGGVRPIIRWGTLQSKGRSGSYGNSSDVVNVIVLDPIAKETSGDEHE